MRRSALTLIAIALLLLVGCESPEPVAPQEPPARSRNAVSAWVPARAPTDRALLEAPARAVAGPGSRARVAPPFAARVTSIAVAPGDVVAAGDVLLEVTMPEVLDAAAIWTSSGSQLSLRRDRQRELEGLREEGLVEQSRVFEQETSLAQLGAERARALAVLQAAGVRPSAAGRALSRGASQLVSPISGVVSAVDAHLGEVRDPSGPPLVEVIGSAPARIEARLSQALPEGAELVFAPLGGDPIALRSETEASAIDPADGTRLVWLAPREPVALPDGLRGTLRVSVMRAGVVEVSEGAVGHDPDGAFVVRRTEDGGARVPVEVLASGGGSAIVEAAADARLEPGDMIATDASVLLRAPESDE